MMVAYEIHTFRDGAWKIDSVFDDKDLAVFEGQRIERSGRFSAIRVVEETFDEATDRTVNRTIYRSTKADRINAETAEQRKQPSGIPAPPRPAAAPMAVKRRKTTSITRLFVVAALTLAAIAFSSLGALYALNSLTH